MDFIFMLTRDDRTVRDCLELIDLIRPVGLKHIGFKDVGVTPDVSKALTKAIHESGATSYMEVVSTTPEACLASARVARDLGVNLRAAEVEAQCRDFVARGCAGCDILAYRATEADPVDLVKAARRGLGPDKYLVVAGAVTSAERIRAVEAAGADAFTIGTAVFNGSYSPTKGSILSQLRDVLADCEMA